MYAVVGGSGLSHLPDLTNVQRKIVRTPFGEPSGPLTFGMIGGNVVVFLARHGYGHTIPPHLVNYRANIWALHSQGIDGIISIVSVGGIHEPYVPGAIVVPDQMLDYTYGREHTFGTGNQNHVSHIDFTLPYSSHLRKKLVESGRISNISLVEHATYATTQGPRLETAAEITRMERDGADLVGMTGMPEAALARELGIEYAALAVVANYAAGRGGSAERIELELIEQVLEAGMQKVRAILRNLFNS